MILYGSKLPIDERENTKAGLPKPIRFNAEHVFHQGKPSLSFFVHLFPCQKIKKIKNFHPTLPELLQQRQQRNFIFLVFFCEVFLRAPRLSSQPILSCDAHSFLLQGMTIGCAIVWPAKSVVGLSFSRRTRELADLKSLLASSTAGWWTSGYPPGNRRKWNAIEENRIGLIIFFYFYKVQTRTASLM